MDTRHMHIKRTVTMIAVTKPQHHISFQVRHPENAKALIAIRVTTTLSRALKIGVKFPFGGTLSMARPDHGDVIFSDELKPDDNTTDDLTTVSSQALADNARYQRNGTQQTFFEVYFPLTDAVWDGYYEDHYVPLGTSVKFTPLYKVSLYLIYELNQQEP